MGKTDHSRPLVVCDAGPLIHLDELGCLDLLSDFPEVLVPEAVWDEVGKHRPGSMTKSGVGFLRTNPRNPVPADLQALTQIFSLHRGEWEALRVALEHPSGILLILKSLPSRSTLHLKPSLLERVISKVDGAEK